MHAPGLRSAISANERLQQLYHPWTSYVIVPIFALANAGIVISGGFLSHAYASPVTLGILVGYVVGKPVGIAGTAWIVTKLSRGRLRPPVGWAAVTGAGAIAGIGFTISILIATHAFHGVQLEEAKLGVLSAALVASLATWLVFRAAARLPRRLRIRALLGTAEPIIDLAVSGRPRARSHPRAGGGAGDRARVRRLRVPVLRPRRAGGARAARRLRRRPLRLAAPSAHRRASARSSAAEAAEAAAEQGKFWELHDLLLDHQDALRDSDLIGYAEELGLDVQRFEDDLAEARAPGTSPRTWTPPI